MVKILKNLRSMAIVFKNLFVKPFTVLYRTDNEERIPMYDRIRGELILDLPNCIGCAICSDSCPNAALTMVDYDSENPKNKKKRAPQLDVGLCSFCGLCSDACPYEVIQMGNEYDRAYLTMDDMIKPPEVMYEEWIEQRGEVEKEEPVEVEE